MADCNRDYFLSQKSKDIIDDQFGKFRLMLSNRREDRLLNRTVISLTTYPARIAKLRYTLYSLVDQTCPTAEIWLWLAEDEFPGRVIGDERVETDLKLLANYGVKVKWCHNYRSYKKLIPALEQARNMGILNIVTADDDLYYWPQMVDILYREHLRHFRDIIAHRAHRVKIESRSGGVKSYHEWEFRVSDADSAFSLFPTTGAGALYPRGAFGGEVSQVELAMRLVPHGDDIWFWAMAVLNHRRIRVPRDCLRGLVYVDEEQQRQGLYAMHNFYENNIQLNNVLAHYPQIMGILCDAELGIIKENESVPVVCGDAVSEKIAKFKLYENNMCYHPVHTKSMFYLPYVASDHIQKIIFLTDNYYEIGYLYKVFVEIQGGRILRDIAGGTVIDVGANIGNHTLFFANELGIKRIISFEAVENTYRILRENIKLNHLDNVVTSHCIGLSDKKEFADVNKYDVENIGATALKRGSGAIELTYLDEFALFDGSIKFIKIDVEGMELDVLNGAKQTIASNMPYIMLESFDDAFERVKNLLTGFGYLYESINSYNYLFYPSNTD